MNFIPEKIEYDAENEIYWSRLFYSTHSVESTAIIGVTKEYLAEIFKQPVDTKWNSGFMNKWRKLAMRDLERELPREVSTEVYCKMYATTPEATNKGWEVLTQKKTADTTTLS